jgi:hypothetical protein
VGSSEVFTINTTEPYLVVGKDWLRFDPTIIKRRAKRTMMGQLTTNPRQLVALAPFGV